MNVLHERLICTKGMNIAIGISNISLVNVLGTSKVALVKEKMVSLICCGVVESWLCSRHRVKHSIKFFGNNAPKGETHSWDIFATFTGEGVGAGCSPGA